MGLIFLLLSIPHNVLIGCQALYVTLLGIGYFSDPLKIQEFCSGTQLSYLITA